MIELQREIDIQWLLLCTFMLVLMQIGFLCLESGLTRAKHSINVAIKNIADLCLVIVVFWLVGFAFMFNSGTTAFIGNWHWPTSLMSSPQMQTLFLFEAMFCCTAVTIISGAIAERSRFWAYLMITVLVSVLIYPVVGHWIWGHFLSPEQGWLHQMGFVDFAGATVVHSVGGWVALAAVLVIGPRSGRFNKDGSAADIPGHHAPVAICGGLFMLAGWFGFNGGSLLTFSDVVPQVILNTLLSAVFAAIVASVLNYLRHGYFDLMAVVNGMLSGLVAITACANLVSAFDSVVIGAIAGILFVVMRSWLLKRQIDDVIMAIPTHLGAGVWGTVAVALFADRQLLPLQLSVLEQLWVQLLGVLVVAIWSFGVAFFSLKLINRLKPLRASLDQEYTGLNYTEHKQKTEWLELLENMEANISRNELSARVPVEPFTEIGQIASQYNRIMDWLERSILDSEQILHNLNEGIVKVDSYCFVQKVNPAAGRIFGVRPKNALGIQLATMFTSIEQAKNLPTSKHGLDELCLQPQKLGGHNLNGEEMTLIVSAVKRFGQQGLYYTLLIQQQVNVQQAKEKTSNEERDPNSPETNLEQANSRRNILLANLAASLKGPLNRVLIYNELSQMDSQLAHEQRQYLDKIELAANELIIQIEDLIYLTGRAPRLTAETRCHFDIKWLLAQVSNHFSQLCAQKGLELNTAGLDGEPDVIYSEPVAMQQMLHKLLENTLSRTDMGEINLSYVRKGSVYQLDLIDSGRPLEPAEAEKLTRTEQQEEESFSAEQLGLAAAFGHMQRLNARCDVQVLANGANVLQIDLTFDEKAVTTKKIYTATGAEIKGRDISIWLIDADDERRYLLSAMLRAMDLKVWATKSVVSVFGHSGAVAPDIIFSSCQIAGLENGKVLHKIRNMWPEPSTVVAVLRAGDEQLASSVEAELVENWPIDMTELVAMVSKLLRIEFSDIS